MINTEDVCRYLLKCFPISDMPPGTFYYSTHRFEGYSTFWGVLTDVQDNWSFEFVNQVL